MAMGMPNTIRYKTDITHANNRIIKKNQQNRKE